MHTVLLMMRDLHHPGALLRTGLNLPHKDALLFSLLHTLFPEHSIPVICPCQDLELIHKGKYPEAAARQGAQLIPLHSLKDGVLSASCHLLTLSCSGD